MYKFIYWSVLLIGFLLKQVDCQTNSDLVNKLEIKAIDCSVETKRKVSQSLQYEAKLALHYTLSTTNPFALKQKTDWRTGLLYKEIEFFDSSKDIDKNPQPLTEEDISICKLIDETTLKEYVSSKHGCAYIKITANKKSKAYGHLLCVFDVDGFNKWVLPDYFAFEPWTQQRNLKEQIIENKIPTEKMTKQMIKSVIGKSEENAGEYMVPMDCTNEFTNEYKGKTLSYGVQKEAFVCANDMLKEGGVGTRNTFPYFAKKLFEDKALVNTRKVCASLIKDYAQSSQIVKKDLLSCAMATNDNKNYYACCYAYSLPKSIGRIDCTNEIGFYRGVSYYYSPRLSDELFAEAKNVDKTILKSNDEYKSVTFIYDEPFHRGHICKRAAVKLNEELSGDDWKNLPYIGCVYRTFESEMNVLCKVGKIDAEYATLRQKEIEKLKDQNGVTDINCAKVIKEGIKIASSRFNQNKYDWMPYAKNEELIINGEIKAMVHDPEKCHIDAATVAANYDSGTSTPTRMLKAKMGREFEATPRMYCVRAVDTWNSQGRLVKFAKYENLFYNCQQVIQGPAVFIICSLKQYDLT